MFGSTNTQRVSSAVLMLGFVLMLVTLYQLYCLLLSLVRIYGVEFRRLPRLATYLTTITGLVIALQSIGQLGPRDVVVLLMLAILAYFYGNYRAVRQSV